ncbi:unnamed protein product [Fusarium venenatum]|uniref:Uncharacterized protein n=1 Tax=Fusarium venenatum TaxID=56646 RepID=A0A2L2TI75_9HYPO|nr:LOW QUALITY PROTEIN: uncharacterized protein FVRRES_04235 [Fusarium venenatum]CEI67723.1 unnamed protein product [Fusarium venenatum]
MAMIRALIRRRLGEDTQYCGALSEYELDYLAIQLVETKCCTLVSLEKNSKSLQQVLSWRVDITKHGKEIIYPFDFPGTVEFDVAFSNHKVLSRTRETEYLENKVGEAPDREAQKVMSVRRRLGDLCEWETKAFKPALMLVRSIEYFLDEFAPDGLSGEDTITWKIPFKSSSDKSGVVELNIIRATKAYTGRNINAGQVGAILSIWMANLEANNTTQSKKDRDTEWQRSEAGVALGVEYCRILGRKYDNGVLQRDINWWVGNPGISEVEVEKQVPEAKPSPQPGTSRTTSFQLRGSTVTNKSSSQLSSSEQKKSVIMPYTYDSSKHKNVKIVIGYTGPAGTEGAQKLLVQHSTAATVTIAMQHLFIHFMWTIVDRLPKNFLDQGSVNVHEAVSVQPPRKLDLSSNKSGIGRKLSHKKLKKFVLHAEKEDLGTFDDVLLCIIPGLSIKDRLPNDATFRFDLPRLTERKG